MPPNDLAGRENRAATKDVRRVHFHHILPWKCAHVSVYKRYVAALIVPPGKLARECLRLAGVRRLECAQSFLPGHSAVEKKRRPIGRLYFAEPPYARTGR